MKILLVNTYHYLRGGDSRLVFETAGALERRGHRVHHFAMQGPNNISCSDARFFVREIDFQQALAVRSLPLVLKTVSTTLFSLEAKTKLAKLLDTIKPDMVHLHSIRHHLTKSILTEFKKRRLPVAWTLHDFKEICPNTSLFNGIEICERCKGRRFRNVVRLRCKKGSLPASLLTYLEARVNTSRFFDSCIDRFISPSRFLKNKFVEFGYTPDSISHLPNFINVDAFTPDYQGDAYLLYFGRIERIKGIHTLIESFASAGLSQKNWRLVIAGDGQASGQLKQLTMQNPHLNVAWVGYQSGGALRKLIQNAGAVIVPSECYDNYPFTVLEAMAYGKVVIGADIGGIPEQIENNKTGFLFTSGDAGQLAERLLGLIEMPPEARQEMGRQARRKVERENSETAHLDYLLSLYRGLIHQKHRG
jgi:glycosyltransferase involved in cell wall biosynthesis